MCRNAGVVITQLSSECLLLVWIVIGILKGSLSSLQGRKWRGKGPPVLSLTARTSKESMVLTGYHVNSFCFVAVCIPGNKQSPLLQVNHCGIFCSLEGPLFENGPLVNGLFYFPPNNGILCSHFWLPCKFISFLENLMFFESNHEKR